VGLLVHQDGYTLAHAGDSRAYRFRGGKLRQLTQDHTVVRQMIEAGLLAPELASQHPNAHQITRALGVSAQIDVEVTEGRDLCQGDLFLLCSDGLTDLVSETDFVERLGRAENLDVQAQALVDLAKHRGGHDNVTVVLVEVVEGASVAGRPTEVDAKAVFAPTVIDGGGEDAPPETLRMPQPLVPVAQAEQPPMPPPSPSPLPGSARSLVPTFTYASRRQLRRYGVVLGLLLLAAMTLICLRQCAHHRHLSSRGGFPFGGGSVTS
jgi:hypothetical protein